MSWFPKEHSTFNDLIEFPNGLLRHFLDLQYRSLCRAEKSLLTEFDFAKMKVLDFGSGAQDFKVRHRVVHYESCDLQGTPTWRNLEQIPQSKRFDLIVACEVFEHLVSPQEVLKKLSKFQSLGQKIYISTPFLAREHGAPEDFQRWTEQGLKTLLENAGYKVETCIRRGHLLTVLSSLLNYSFFKGLKTKFSPFFLLLFPLVLVLLLVSHISLGMFRHSPHYLGLSVLATKTQSKDL